MASLIKPLTVFPIVSHDIFSIESEFELKELIVSDVAGRIYNIALAGNNSQINLGSFPSGIYFYAITDEKEKVWRGRLIKD